MSNEEVYQSATVSARTESGVPHLSLGDVDRLTAYKWRYSLESHGFSSHEAHRLLFMKWLYGHGRVRS
jgi:hypothetical protein